MRAFSLLALVLATAAQAQAPSPAQMGITSTTPQVLETLDSSKRWVPLGTTSGGVFTSFGAGTDVRAYGAKCDGTTDDYNAIQAGLNASGSIILPGRCYSSAMITIPDNGSLAGRIFAPGTAGLNGSVLLCNATLHGPCVTGGNGTHAPFVMHDLVIARGAGTVPSDGECFLEVNNELTHVYNVECYNHAQGFESRAALGNYFHNIHTCKIADAHFIVNSSPGVYVDGFSWFGCNGAFDLNSNAYVRITGNFDQTKGTVHFTDTQFNQGFNRVACAFSFENFTGTANAMLDFEIIGGHEEVAQKGFCSDSTVKQLLYLQIIGLGMFGGWGGANSLFNFDPATSIYFWTLTGSSFDNWASAVLAPVTTMDAPTITGNVFAATPLSITFPAGSSIAMEGNSYSGLTLSGTIASPSKIGGTARSSPNPYNYTGLTGQVEIDIPGHSDIPCTMGLTFGGSSTGMTFANQRCGWQMRGSTVMVAYGLFLSAKGTSTGVAQLTGLPLTSSAIAATLNPMNYANMTNTCVTAVPNCGVYASVNISGTTANVGTWGSSNMIGLTDVNFNNNTNLQGILTYVWGGGP